MVNNETVKLIAAYLLMAKNHKNNAELLAGVAEDWISDPIVYETLVAERNIELSKSTACDNTVFNLTKQLL